MPGAWTPFPHGRSTAPSREPAEGRARDEIYLGGFRDVSCLGLEGAFRAAGLRVLCDLNFADLAKYLRRQRQPKPEAS